jgi:hypothetical protein
MERMWFGLLYEKPAEEVAFALVYDLAVVPPRHGSR